MRRNFTVTLHGEPTGITAEVTPCGDESGPYPEVEIVDVAGWLLNDLTDAEIDEICERVILHVLAAEDDR